MKKLLVFLMVLVAMLFPVVCFSADLHKVSLRSIAPFFIDVGFPNTIENDAFGFNLLGSDEIDGIDYKAIVGISKSDKRYQILLVVVTVDDGKTNHVVAAMSANMIEPELDKMKSYKDEAFYKRGIFSGVLVQCARPPTPDDLKAVAAMKRVGV
jgi:hypothetical protein